MPRSDGPADRPRPAARGRRRDRAWRSPRLERIASAGSVHTVPVGQADPGTSPGHLGDAVLPAPLGLTPGHQEVASTEEERRGPAAPLGAEEESTRLPEGDQGHDRLGDLLGDPVDVPRDAVPAISVQVEPNRVEGPLVPIRENVPDLPEDRRLERLARVEAPRSGEPRFRDPLVVHPPGPLLPAPRRKDLLEQDIGPRDPAGSVVDP